MAKLGFAVPKVRFVESSSRDRIAKMSHYIAKDTARRLLREVDSNRNGKIEFEECVYLISIMTPSLIAPASIIDS